MFGFLRYGRVTAFLILSLCFSTLLSAHSSTALGLASVASQSASIKASAKIKGPLIVLDAGHGGSDEGAKVRQLQEKKVALLTTLYAKKYLEELGYRVLLTRSKDTYVSLPKRVSIANKIKGRLFVSIHCNSAPNTLAEGAEVFYYKEKDQERAVASKKLATYVLHYLLEQTEATSRGVKAGNFHVIRETEMPAIIVEPGFLTNYEEWASLRKKSYLEKIAKGIAQGVDKYLKTCKEYVPGAS